MEQRKQAVKWEKVHVFISSTFNDMHAERDYLVKRVFPELQEWCEKRKLRLVDIDLRWGVTEQDATHNKNVVKVCLSRIDDCRPFFLCFLGQRRGWVPKTNEISAETYQQFPELQSHAGAASVTELEILHAVLNPLHKGTKQDSNKPPEYYDRAEHAFFYLRDDAYLTDIPLEPPLLRQTYTNEGIVDPAERERHDRELNLWRSDLSKGDRPCHLYTATWDEQASTPEIMLPLASPSADPGNIACWRDQWTKAGINVTGEDIAADPALAKQAVQFNQLLSKGRLTGFKCSGNELQQVIIRDLKEAIAARYPDHLENLEESELQKELDQQEEFLYLNSEGFIERTGDFDELDRYLGDDSRQLFVLTAPGGMGKSMLLANWIDRHKEQHGDDHTMHFRFVGQSDRSTTVPNLLRSLMLELQLARKIPKTTTEKVKGRTGNEATREVDFEIPNDPIKIQNLWNEQLAAISKQGKTVIVIDAINQLDTGLKDLVWLPLYGLPEKVKIIISFREDAEGAQALLERFAANEKHIRQVRVKPFTYLDDRRKLVNAYLTNFLKEIDERHLEEIIALKGAENPLYLKVVLSELRVFGSFASLADKIRNDFGDSPVSAFNGVLHRLENDPAYSAIIPKDAVPLLFGLMLHARSGLSSEELAGIFMRALNLPKTEEQKVMALDTARLFLRQVRPFLERRDGRFDFFYESFKTAALERYVQVDESQASNEPGKRITQEWHQILAEYFSRLPLWENENERKPTRRKVSELPYHQTMGEMWEEAENTLCSLCFIEAKCTADMTYDLVADFSKVFKAIPDAQKGIEKEQAFQSTVQQYVHDLIACADGHGNTPDVRKLVRMSDEYRDWTLIERVSNAHPRLKRLYAFSLLVNVTAVYLHKFSGILDFCSQLAYNLNSCGPVAEAAEGQIAEIHHPLILWESNWREVPNPFPCLVQINHGHAEVIYCVAITADGRRAVSGSVDKTLRVWDLDSGQCIRVLTGHQGVVSCVALTPDGSKALSGDGDDTLKVWDLDSGQCIRVLTGHKSVKGVALTPDGSKAISGGGDDTLKVWDLDSGQCIRVLTGHKNLVKGVALTPDGHRAISGSWDGTLRVWDLDSGQCIRVLTGHHDWVDNVALTPDGRRAISGSRDGTLRVWDLDSGHSIRILTGHPGGVNCVALTPDGRKAVSCSDRTVQVWDLVSSQCLQNLKGHKSIAGGVAVTPDGRRAISVDDDGMLIVWDITGLPTHHVQNILITSDKSSYKKMLATLPRPLRLIVEIIESICHFLKNYVDRFTFLIMPIFMPRQLNAKLQAEEENIQTQEENIKLLKYEIFLLKWKASAMCLDPAGRLFVIASYPNYELYVFNTITLERIKVLGGHTFQPSSISISNDGNSVVSISGDYTIRVWNLLNDEHKIFNWNKRCKLQTVHFMQNGRSAILSSDYGMLLLLDIDSGIQHVIEQTGGKNSALAIAADGQFLVCGGSDNILRLINLKNSQHLRTNKECKTRCTSIAVSPDGRNVVYGGSDAAIWVWDLHSNVVRRLINEGTNNGQSLTFKSSYGDTINWQSLTFTPDGLAILGLYGGILQLIDFASGSVLACMPPAGQILYDNFDMTTRIGVNGTFAVHTSSSEHVYLAELKNYQVRAPIVTPTRFWQLRSDEKGQWEDKISMVCPHCYRRILLADKTFDTIRMIACDNRLTPDQIPCLALPPEVWDNPHLFSECPDCHKPLRLNPFVIDERDGFP